MQIKLIRINLIKDNYFNKKKMNEVDWIGFVGVFQILIGLCAECFRESRQGRFDFYIIESNRRGHGLLCLCFNELYPIYTFRRYLGKCIAYLTH